MTTVLARLYGVQPDLEAGLRALGIRNNEDLLRFCQSEGSLRELAAATGFEVRDIRRLVHRASFARIRGIGEGYMHLLEEAGVETLNDLATRCPEDLRAQLQNLNGTRQLVGRVPALAMVNGWVTKARQMPKVLD